MNLRRTLAVFRLDLAENRSRPIFWILILILGFTAWGLSRGEVTIQSGNSAVGGTKAWITSEFNNGKMLSMVIFLWYSFFVAILAGLAVLRDDESKVGELLHSTPLTAGEYIWGKFSAVLAAFFGIMAIHVLMAAFCILPSFRSTLANFAVLSLIL